MTSSRPLSAAYFDGWYADMAKAPVKDEIQQRHLGLPQDVLSTSLLPWEGVREVATLLGLSPGDTLLDLACGRGGYGLELATRTQAQLLGVDFSAEAVRQARDHSRRFDCNAEFRVGDLTDTGLGDRCVDAALCIDSIQFARQPSAAYGELLRVLMPGGRVVLTCWEPVHREDERLGERLRRVDLGDGLRNAGFDDVAVTERPGWQELERGMWEEAAALDSGGDAALESFHDEGVRTLATFDLLRRVLATATAPEISLPTA
jgi:SAM-dependent methyltransferase